MMLKNGQGKIRTTIPDDTATSKGHGITLIMDRIIHNSYEMLIDGKNWMYMHRSQYH